MRLNQMAAICLRHTLAGGQIAINIRSNMQKYAGEQRGGGSSDKWSALPIREPPKNEERTSDKQAISQQLRRKFLLLALQRPTNLQLQKSTPARAVKAIPS